MNILEQAQSIIVDILTAEIPNISFLAENRKDIEYEISQNLDKQGLVAVVLTPGANFVGNNADKCIAWECDINIEVIENVVVNRGKKGNPTGQDVAMQIFDILSSPKYKRQGQFSPIRYEQVEDEGFLVNKCSFKCLVVDTEL